MPRIPNPTFLAIALLAACSVAPPAIDEVVLGPPETSALVFQAVDAGTGSALTDAEMTVRYLVRAPITLDASAVEQAPSNEPYTITLDVAQANLVLEVRLEADSYHRLDTVLSVPRGATSGPFTIRMARRLDQVALGGSNRQPEARPAPSRPVTPPPSQPTTSATPAAVDRSALAAGNRAFAQGDWLGAAEAYSRMPEPNDPDDDYAAEYAPALVKRGNAHLNRGEMGGALEAFEMATRYSAAGFRAELGLGRTQCAVGRTEEGRGTLAILGRDVNRMRPAERPLVVAMIEYERGRCSEGEFDRAQATLDRVRTGAAALREYQAFLEAAADVSPVTTELQTALDDADERIAAIRERIRS